MKNIIYIAILLIISLIIAISQPEMHKQAIITDSEYGFIEIETPQAEAPVTPVDTNNGGNINISAQPMETRSVQVGQYSQPTTPVKTTRQQATGTKPASQKVQQQAKPVQKPAYNKTESPVQQPKTQTKTQLPQPKTVDVKPTQNIENKPTIKPTLTEQEEIIAWNRWRSRVQNQVMKDANVLAPLGTVFKFSFTVDKFGNMSNVKVWSPNPMYNNYAIKQIKPVLMSYRNKPILNFPEGTKRIITNVEGGFTISRVTQYSRPEDYHDYEHVKR